MTAEEQPTDEAPVTTVHLRAEDLAQVVDASPVGYVMSDPHGRIELVNTTLLRWLGYSRSELVGRRTFQQLLAPGGRIYYDTHLRPMLDMQDEVREIAVEAVRADGSRLPVLINVARRVLPSTGSSMIETVVFDATERRRYEQELLAERRHAERSEAQLQFLYDLATALAGAVTVDDVVGVIHEHGRSVELGARCGVYLLDADDRAAYFAGGVSALEGAGIGADRSRIEFPDGGSALDVLRAGELVVIADCEGDAARYPLLCRWLLDGGSRAAVVAPLFVDDVLYGVLGYGFDELHDFDRSELRAIRSFAAQAGQALGRAAALEAERRSRARLANLLRFTALLSESVTLDDVIDSIVQSATSLLGAVGVRVALLDETGSALEFVRQGGLGAESREVVSLDDATIAGEAVRTREVVVRTTRDALLESFPDSPILEQTTFGRIIAAPLLDGNDPLGAWTLVFAEEGPPDDDDTRLIELFVDQAANAIRRGRMFDLEHQVAVTLQQSLLATVPDVPGWRVDTWYAPGSEHLVVGGDLFDVTALDDGRLTVVVADVVGHGLGAAAAMGQMRSAAKALSLVLSTPAAVLRGLDDFARTTPGVMYSSVCCVMLEADGSGRYACAGHPQPLVRQADGTTTILRSGRSPLLGVPSDERTDAVLTLEPGSTLVIYTDGLVERRGRDVDDEVARLRAVLKATDVEATPAHSLSVAMLDHSEPSDDVVVVCVSRSD